MLKDNFELLKKLNLNLANLIREKERVNVETQVVQAKNGLQTLQVLKTDRPFFLHSKYDPIVEAERIIDQITDIEEYNHIFFYGLGMGYHVEELLKRYPNKKFTLFEPNEEVFYQYIRNKDLKKLPLNQMAFFKVGLTVESEIKEFLKEFFNYVQEKTLLVTLPSYERFLSEQYKNFLQEFKQLIGDKRQGMLVNYSFQKRWTLNSWLNLPVTLKSPNILQDVDSAVFKDKPAIIVAAGPSLNEELENLRSIKEKGLAYIFSVGSSINTLVENNIFPDAMCTYDPSVINQKVFEKLSKKKIYSIPMIYGTSVGFETLKNYPGPKFHMVTSQDTISNYYIKRKDQQDIDKVQDAPSIAVVTLELLYKLGCNPIIMVGQNLAYKDKLVYSKDMGYQHATSEISEDELKQAIPVKSVEGKDILTNDSFNRMRTQIEYYLKEFIHSKDVINTTKGGAFIEGTTYKELLSFINEDLFSTSPISREGFSIRENKYDLQYLKEKQQVMISNFEELIESLRKIKKLFIKMDQLIIERKIVKLEKMFGKFDIEMKQFVKNEFYLTFLQPMSRVEFDLLTKDINSLKFDSDIIYKARKTLKSFKRFLNSCEFDIKNFEPIFKEVNKDIEKIINESQIEV